jgi:hypothetical protein
VRGTLDTLCNEWSLWKPEQANGCIAKEGGQMKRYIWQLSLFLKIAIIYIYYYVTYVHLSMYSKIHFCKISMWTADKQLWLRDMANHNWWSHPGHYIPDNIHSTVESLHKKQDGLINRAEQEEAIAEGDSRFTGSPATLTLSQMKRLMRKLKKPCREIPVMLSPYPHCSRCTYSLVFQLYCKITRANWRSIGGNPPWGRTSSKFCPL